MQPEINKPIFVVGSPRSGTSILAWCLGQHPNMFPVPESHWMGQFAINVALSYEIGSWRGNRSLLSGMDIGREEFFANFGRSINHLILSHRDDLNRKRKMTRPSADPKARWVSQTPEYSLYICGLRKLFPEAVFVHIVRDVTSVVRSMLNFHRVSGFQLVASEQEAYEYWLRTASSCLDAERAYGPWVVHRVRYSDLVARPETTLGAVFDFLGEPYVAACLGPLQKRVNSSNVPVDFQLGDDITDQLLVAKARTLSAELEQTPQSNEASPEIVTKMEAAFKERVQYAAQICSEYQKIQEIISEIRGRTNDKTCATPTTESRKESLAVFKHIRDKAARPETELSPLELPDDLGAVRRVLENRERRMLELEASLTDLCEKNSLLHDTGQLHIDHLERRIAELEDSLHSVGAQNAKNASRVERLAREVKNKRAIIQHFRGRRKRRKLRLRRLFFWLLAKQGRSNAHLQV